MKNRQEWNKKVLEKIKEKYILINSDINNLIEQYPQQRFGQIICNYVCSDYRDKEKSEVTKHWLDTDIFPDNMDFFFEEPWETYKRLCGE